MMAAVADGVGGSRFGEAAAEHAIGAVQGCADLFLAECADGREALDTALQEAQEAVLELREQVGGAAATTLTAVAVEGDVLEFSHVGDSRLYLLRDGHIRLLTEDQRDRDGALQQAVGYLDCPKVSCGRERLRLGDVVLLCTDGLAPNGGLNDREIAARLRFDQPLRERLEGLADEALRRGSQDNITAVALEISEAAPTEVPESGEVAEGREGPRGGVSLHRQWLWLIASGFIMLTIGILTGWFAAQITLWPAPRPLGSPPALSGFEHVASVADGSRLAGASSIGGIMVIQPDGEIMVIAVRGAVAGRRLLGRVSVASGPSDYIAYWDDASQAVVRRTREQVDAVFADIPSAPDSIAVDPDHNIWLIVSGKLYVARAQHPPAEEEGANRP